MGRRRGTEVRQYDPTETVGKDTVASDIRVVMAASTTNRQRKYYRAFILDTGSPFDIVQRGNVEQSRGVTLAEATKPVGLQTAGGPQTAREVAHMTVLSLREEITLLRWITHRMSFP